MSKQPAFNGIDYTPRNPVNTRPIERHIHGVVQRQMHHPIYEVKAAGKTVEWTDIRTDAHGAFHKTGAYPKQISLVHADGRRVLLDQISSNGQRVQSDKSIAA